MARNALTMKTSFRQVKDALQALADPEKARILSGFFKTGRGQYGEGDVFLGITVPLQRGVAKRYPDLPLRDLGRLLSSRIHEQRLTALFILIMQYRKADDHRRRRIVHFYLAHTRGINNWDLVDLSAEKILGDYLIDRDKSVLYRLVRSQNLWERRMAVIATFAFIKKHEFQHTLCIAEALLSDKHDLIHKAVGWMLREIGKRDLPTEEEFLGKHSLSMPRTMLRYAIERFDPDRRGHWMSRREPSPGLTLAVSKGILSGSETVSS